MSQSAAAGPNSESIRSHLAEVLSSSHFASAPRLSRFLSFIVEAALDGKSSELKESLIAVEVYGRPADYNPQVDSTVRVEAWRLRSKLREYYETNACDGLVVIELPKGRYVPVFREKPAAGPKAAAEPKAAEPARQLRTAEPLRVPHQRLLVAAVASIALVAGAAAVSRWNHTHQIEKPDPGTLKLFSRAWELLRHYRTEDGRILAAEDSVRQSVSLFQEVVQRHPRFARGWASLAEATEFAYELDPSRSNDLLTSARTAARRAVELDQRLPEAHAALCSILFFRDWDLTGAESACHQAVEANPRDVVAQRRLADLRRVMGHSEKAAKELEGAISMTPADPGLRLRKARLYYDARQYKQAAEETRASLTLNISRQLPSWTLALWLQGLCYEQFGQAREAEASYREALAHDGDDMWNESALAHLLARTGRRAEAEAILREIEQRVARGEGDNFAVALVRVGLGQHAKALDSLERGFGRRDDTMLFLGLEQRFHPIHHEPRFQALLGQLRDRAPSPVMAARLAF